MTILGLIFNMIGVVILGLQPTAAYYDTGIHPRIAWLDLSGWTFLFIGFGLMLYNELRKNKAKK